MSDGLNQQERYQYMANLLKKHSFVIYHMNDEYLRDYVELIHLFLNRNDSISQMGNVSTMELIAKKTLRDAGF